MKSKNSTRPKTSVRLSKNVIPRKYDLELRPDLESFTFEGTETIIISILKSTRSLTLHSKELEIQTVHVVIGDEKVFASKITYDQKAETATFTFPKDLEVLPHSGGRTSKYKLTIVWRGILNDKMRGFYRSHYQVAGKTCHMATTQFESTDARRAFPCFDEPAQKAVFRVCLVVPRGKIAISNTLPETVKEHTAGYDIIRFSPTPKMSTYLLAFIVGDFEYLEAKTKRGVLVRVYTTEGKKHQARFALECAVKTLEFYEKYFDIRYPLNTLDMVAIPDFQAQAMENWGLVTYRESALLVDDDHTSLTSKQWVALVIAHELAHQWFGNLVTMKWWTHLWLNEGFASYIEYLAVDKLFPKWDIWTQFCNYDMGSALRLDALANTHPIEIEVHHPDEIGEIFDEVSYHKGSSVIRMLAGYIGEKNFRDGLRYYLKKHSYKNTETIHLWQAFEKTSRLPVAKVMKNWTSKPGYPLVKAKVVKNKLVLSQERFFASPISKHKAKDKTRWQIPITIKSQDSLWVCFLGSLAQADGPSSSLRQQAEIDCLIKSMPTASPGWLKLNAGEAGFFRTAYSHELLEGLALPVSQMALSPRDRLGLIRDLFALAESGDVPTVYALEFLTNYTMEDNYTVWVEILQGLGRLEQILAKTKTKAGLDDLILGIFSPLARTLGWKQKHNEPHTDTLLRPLALSRAGRSGDKKIVKEAKRKFQTAQKKKGAHIDPDIRGPIYSIVAQNGGMDEYKTFVKKYKAETLHEEKNRLGSALGNFSNPKILKKVCEFAMSKSVRPQDTISILSSIAMNPHGRDIWLSFIKKNWQTLTSRYGKGGHTLARLLKAFGGSAEEKHFKSFKKFFKSHPTPGADRAVEQVLERLEGNIAWQERDGKKIERFLKYMGKKVSL